MDILKKNNKIIDIFKKENENINFNSCNFQYENNQIKFFSKIIMINI